MIPCIQDNSYEDRLRMLNLFQFSRKRFRGDLIVNPFNEFESLKVNYMRFFRVWLTE